MFTTAARIFAWDSVGKQELGISTANWAVIKSQLGHEGGWKSYLLRDDGLREFVDTGPQRSALFKSQITEALGNGGTHWQAPRWNAFARVLGRENARKYATIITARLHSPDSILEGLKVLRDRGWIPSVPDKANLFAVGWPGLDEKFKGSSPSESKSKVMLYLLDQVESHPVPTTARLIENREGTGREPHASLVLFG